MSTSVWVAKLLVSQRTAEKVSSKHGYSVADVKDEVVCVPGLAGVWDYHEERGWRMLIEVTIGDDHVLVVLYPTDDEDVWKLGSAHPHKPLT